LKEAALTESVLRVWSLKSDVYDLELVHSHSLQMSFMGLFFISASLVCVFAAAVSYAGAGAHMWLSVRLCMCPCRRHDIVIVPSRCGGWCRMHTID